MNLQEAADVLDHGDTDAARALIGLANGWPAVIGLASFADLSAILEQDGLPLDLHDYVAEELYAVLAEDVQKELSRLALLPNLSNPLIEGLLENGSRILAEGQRAGFLIATGPSALDLHPLLRSFLLEKFQTLDQELIDSTVHDAIRLLMDAHCWEEAFALLCRFNRLELLDELVAQALDELVEHGRIETLKTWVDFGRSAKLKSPPLELLEAEYCFRAGRHDRAKIFAVRAAEDIAPNSALASRAFYRAGQNAHLTDSPEEALRYLSRPTKSGTDIAKKCKTGFGESSSQRSNSSVKARWTRYASSKHRALALWTNSFERITGVYTLPPGKAVYWRRSTRRDLSPNSWKRLATQSCVSLSSTSIRRRCAFPQITMMRERL